MAAKGLCRKPVHLRLHSRPIHAKLCEIRVIGRRNPSHGIDPGRLSNTSTARYRKWRKFVACCGMLWPNDANGFWNLRFPVNSNPGLDILWRQSWWHPALVQVPSTPAPQSSTCRRYHGNIWEHTSQLSETWTRASATIFKLLCHVTTLHLNGKQQLGQ